MGRSKGNSASRPLRRSVPGGLIRWLSLVAPSDHGDGAASAVDDRVTDRAERHPLVRTSGADHHQTGVSRRGDESDLRRGQSVPLNSPWKVTRMTTSLVRSASHIEAQLTGRCTRRSVNVRSKLLMT